MRKSRVAPLVEVDRDHCCEGTLTAQAAELPLWQAIPAGTTAWRISMGRRQVAESANAALKGVFVDLGRGFMRVMGRVKATVLLGFTVAAYNIDRVRAFRAKHRIANAEDATGFPPIERRAPKRRRATWAQIIEGRPPD